MHVQAVIHRQKKLHCTYVFLCIAFTILPQNNSTSVYVVDSLWH